MDKIEVEDRLRAKGVKPTPNRLLVWRALSEQSRPMSLSDLEEVLESVDKSSIFRVLTLFLVQDVAHAFEDGQGVMRYELCASHGPCDMSDSHVHFYCESCRETFCLEDTRIREIRLPDGFVPHSVSFVVKGLCPDCQRRRTEESEVCMA